MKKKIMIYFLISFCSFATFGQNVVGLRGVPNEGKIFPVAKYEKKVTQKNSRIVTETSAIGNFLRADPNMPIIDLPKEFPSEMYINILPKDFPSNMPIMGKTSPGVEKLLRQLREKTPDVYRRGISKQEVP